MVRKTKLCGDFKSRKLKVLLLIGNKIPLKLIKLLTSFNCDVTTMEEPLDSTSRFDFVFSYKYRHIINQKVIQKSAAPIINLHISYLPWNRGASPIFWSFFDGTPSGVSIHLVDSGIDTGDILYQKYLYIDCKNISFETAYRLHHEEIELLFAKNLNEILSKKYIPKKQIFKGTYHSSSDLPEVMDWSNTIDNEISKVKSNIFSQTEIIKDNLKIRFMDRHDSIDLLLWRNNLESRIMSKSSDVINWTTHRKWFIHYLNETNHICFIGSIFRSLNIGFCGFKINTSNNVAIISININPVFRGKGLSTFFLKSCIDLFFLNYTNTLNAVIKNNNSKSIRIFESCNFKPKETIENYEIYQLSYSDYKAVLINQIGI